MKEREKAQGYVIFCEKSDGVVIENSLELITKATSLNKDSGQGYITAVVLAQELAKEEAQKLYQAGATEVVLLRHSSLENYRPDLYAGVLAEYLKKKNPRYVFIGATALGEELAPSLGVKLHTGVAAHCIDLSLDERGNLIQMVPAFGGKVVGEIFTLNTVPQIASVKEGIFAKSMDTEKIEAYFETIDVSVEEHDQGFVLVKKAPLSHSKATLQKAEVIVAGGYGVGSRNDWDKLEELAEILGGATGCTRPALDEGWVDNDRTMIGTSGVVVKPKLYFGIGISGAAHHLCGVKDAEVIISINNDPGAPIIASSDYAIIEDWRKIIPQLIETLRENITYHNSYDA